MDSTRTFNCTTCGKSFLKKYNLVRHRVNVHNFVKPNSSGIFTETEHDQRENCKLCSRTFTKKGNLKRHMLQIHDIEDDNQGLGSFECPLCNLVFNLILRLQEHIQKDHGVNLETVTKVFESVVEFQKWKRNVEEEDLSFFIKHRSKGNKTDYKCHRSGPPRVTATGKRLNWSSSVKIGSTCPARMKVTNVEGRITVNYCKTHVGHLKSVGFLRLTKDERDELARKIKIGVTFDRILDDIRESISSNGNLHRRHIVDKRDLYNIVRDYGLDRDVVREDDAFTCITINEEENISDHDSSMTESQEQAARMVDDVSASSRLIALLNATLENVDSATEEGKLKAYEKIEEAFQILQSYKKPLTN